MLVLTEPIGSGASAGRSPQSASASAVASIGSPTAACSAPSVGSAAPPEGDARTGSSSDEPQASSLPHSWSTTMLKISDSVMTPITR